jgi:hypothetical protein
MRKLFEDQNSYTTKEIHEQAKYGDICPDCKELLEWENHSCGDPLEGGYMLAICDCKEGKNHIRMYVESVRFTRN